ncbi:hypothetical protein FOXYSP1_18042 [Fusarium oxysporum f. sp. phaseoli]
MTLTRNNSSYQCTFLAIANPTPNVIHLTAGSMPL